MGVLVTCRGISKHFGTRAIFDALSISFADGERIGFLGPNGSGKTTFLKILTGLEQPHVAVEDVAELVGNHALEFVAVELLEAAAGDADRRVAR